MRVVLKGHFETDFGSLVKKFKGLTEAHIGGLPGEAKGQTSPDHLATVYSQLRKAGRMEL